MSEENMLFAQMPDPEEQDNTTAEVQTDKYLIFLSDQLLYGIDANLVVEIITDHTITYLPRLPHYVRGIINLRGQIIPIIDIRLRLGKPPREDCCVVVANVDNNLIGILVDGMEKMVDISKEAILPIPTHSSQKLVSGMCSLPDGGTMLILDCDQLVHE